MGFRKPQSSPMESDGAAVLLIGGAYSGEDRATELNTRSLFDASARGPAVHDDEPTDALGAFASATSCVSIRRRRKGKGRRAR